MLSFPVNRFKDFHLLQALLYSIVGLMLSTAAWGIEISEPRGISQIGQPIELKSSVAQIPVGTESQMRSTCLKARIFPFEDLSSGPSAKMSSEIFVNFDPTVKRGGLMEFRSAQPVNEALIELELVSECPLLVFKKRWTLIMAQSEGQTQPAVQTTPGAVVSGKFDLEGSTLLAASRKPPVREARRVSALAVEPADVKSVKDKKENAGDPLKTNVMEDVKPVQVASVNPDLLGTGSMDLQQHSPGGAYQGGDGGMLDLISQAGLLDSLMLPISAAVLILASLGLIIHKRRMRPHNGEDLLAGAGGGDFSVAANNADKPHLFSADPQAVSNHRLLESFLGGEDSQFDDPQSSQADVPHVSSLDEAERQSLKASLELVNRSHIRSWVLPDSYMALVENRNQSLGLHRTVDALLLRCHLGLVELAFQDAKLGNMTNTASTGDLLEHVLGEKIEDSEVKPILFVPDLVKSHVRAKMCEIVGAEKRQLLKENLVSLNTQVLSPALCFSSNSWREFLSEEGILE